MHREWRRRHRPIGLRAALEARRAELERQGAGEAAKTGTVTLDQQAFGRLSRVDALQGQQMAFAQARRRAGEMARIETALTRLDDDVFGYCDDCGKPIARRRLELDPTVRTCIGCAG